VGDVVKAVHMLPAQLVSAYLPIRIASAMNLREHWTVRSRRIKGERAAARLAVLASSGASTYTGAKAFRLPVVVTLTRIAPRQLDDDNLASGFKGIRDGVAEALGTDDRNPLVTWRYAQRRGDPREYAMTIEITPRTEPEA
jgi:hypothetical protein